MAAVVFNQFTRKDHQTPLGGSVEMPVARKEKLGEFSRKGGGRFGVDNIARIAGDSRFRGVRHNEAKVRVLCATEERGKFRMRCDSPADGGDDPSLLCRASALNAAENLGVESVLLVEQGNRSGGERLDDDDAPVEKPLRIQLVDHPIDEPAKETTFTKLQDALRAVPAQHGCC